MVRGLRRRESTAGGVPVIGGSALLGAAGDLRRDLVGTFERAMLDHGGRPVRFRVGPPGIGYFADAVVDPEGARQVLGTDAALYDKQAAALKEFRRFVGGGLLTSDGDRWRRDRRIVAPLFTRRRIASYVPSMARSAERLASSWEPIAGQGGHVDLIGPAMLYTLDVLGAAVFGEDMEAAEAVVRRSVPVINEAVTRAALNPIRLPSWLPTPASRRADQARRAVWDFVEDLIRRRRAAAASPDDATAGKEVPGGTEGGQDLLSLLLAATDPESGVGLDDIGVRDQALIFLLAGHETTGATLAFALHLLGRHPEVQQRVRDEVDRVVGRRSVEAADIENLTYCVHVLDETMRLYPAAHTLIRRSLEAGTLGDHPIPADRTVAVSVWAIHHNPAVWPDPHRFDPSRFEPGEGSAEGGGGRRPVARYAHFPFGGGPRGCIGQYLATAELVVAIATLVRAFHLEAMVDRPSLDVGVSLLPAPPLPCRLRLVAPG